MGYLANSWQKNNGVVMALLHLSSFAGKNPGAETWGWVMAYCSPVVPIKVAGSSWVVI